MTLNLGLKLIFMVMEWYTDRTWMYKMTNDDGFINMEYSGNLNKWLDFVYSNESVVDRRVTKREIGKLFKSTCYRDRETVQKYYVWEDEYKSLIYSCWETCIKGKFPDLLMSARNKAKALATQEGIEVRDDLTVILPFKPHWISQELWTTLVEAWNTASWKGKCSINIDNRRKAKGGRHTLGSKSFVTVRHNLDKALKRRASFDEYWLQTHAKKWSRPLDRLAGHSKSVTDGSGEVNGVEETVQEQNVTWVDSRARESYETYKEYVQEKNAEDDNLDSEFDLDLWLRTTGGKKKGRLYGSSNTVDPYVVMAGASSMPGTGSSYPPSKSDEVQRLKEQIEKDKEEKQAMMEKIEENTRLYAEMNDKLQLLLKSQQQNLPPS
ncbi:hypothetical protein R6Q59_027048 [Mikania micrantha]